MPLVLANVLTSLGMHHQTDIVRLTNTGAVSCSLRGYPTLSSENASGHASEITIRHEAGPDGAPDVPATVVLPPNGIAYFYEFSGVPLNEPVCHPSRGRVHISVTGVVGAQKLDQGVTWALCDGLVVYLTPYFSMTELPAWLAQLSQNGYPLPPG